MDIDENPNVGKLRKVKQVITPNHLDGQHPSLRNNRKPNG